MHSVDSVRLIEELAKRAPEGGADILIQVNVADEESKYGVSEERGRGAVGGRGKDRREGPGERVHDASAAG